MADILWRKADCQNCKLRVPTALIVHWGFDTNGTLCIQGVCRFCMRAFTITHTREEQEADTREAFNQWVESGEAPDFKWWEREFGGEG